MGTMEVKEGTFSFIAQFGGEGSPHDFALKVKGGLPALDRIKNFGEGTTSKLILFPSLFIFWVPLVKYGPSKL